MEKSNAKTYETLHGEKPPNLNEEVLASKLRASSVIEGVENRNDFLTSLMDLDEKEYLAVMKVLAKKVKSIIPVEMTADEYWEEIEDQSDMDALDDGRMIEEFKIKFEAFQKIGELPKEWADYLLEGISGNGFFKEIEFQTFPFFLHIEKDKSSPLAGIFELFGGDCDFLFNYLFSQQSRKANGLIDIEIEKRGGVADPCGVYRDVNIKSKDGRFFINHTRSIEPPFNNLGFSSKVERFISEMCTENDIDLFFASMKAESLAWAIKHDYKPRNKEDRERAALRFYDFLYLNSQSSEYEDPGDGAILLRKG